MTEACWRASQTGGTQRRGSGNLHISPKSGPGSVWSPPHSHLIYSPGFGVSNLTHVLKYLTPGVTGGAAAPDSS